MNRSATASQSLGNPERKNTPCISDLAGVKFLLKKERVFFFRGSALQVFGQVAEQCGRSFGKTIFWGNVAQNLKTKLSETKEKLDKLISIYLDGDIEREIYLQRKDLLLRQKAKFEESFKVFGQQRKNWVEPLRSFVLSLREAVILEKGENYFAWKEFFQKIGSNPILKDKTLSCHWGELWEFTASAVGGKSFEKIDSAILASAKSLHFFNSEQVSFGGIF